MLRSIGFPQFISKCALIAKYEDIIEGLKFTKEHPNLSIKIILILNYDQSQDLSMIDIPVIGPENINQTSYYEKLWFKPNMYEASAFLRKWRLHGVEHVWFILHENPLLIHRNSALDLYIKNDSLIREAFDLCETDEDRRIFSGVLKANALGYSGYIPISAHDEYYHPEVLPKAGDIMIDGGVSDIVDEEIRFCHSIGKNGMIYSFEPIEWMIPKAKEKLAGFSNIKIFPYALSNINGTAKFIDARYSSRKANPNDKNTVECKLITVDTFVSEHNIEKVDCIKLDIEGSEIDALEGAKETIRKFKPKLIICLYHIPSDIYKIPLLIKNIEGNYKIHISHHGCMFIDTVLYAYCPAEN